MNPYTASLWHWLLAGFIGVIAELYLVLLGKTRIDPFVVHAMAHFAPENLASLIILGTLGGYIQLMSTCALFVLALRENGRK